jgi:formylglycine-generating enzyme required for sulfatase activity/tRNA A-37 threonylcarbamoyl transferase component Bud32
VTPESWQRVKEALGDALERDAAGRAALLRELAASDPDLAGEVESLIASCETGSELSLSFVAEPAALAPGTRLGPYEVLDLLARGGMGEVYRARDTRLERDVAVKVLPSHLVADRMALKRLEREAKAIAALSHPNILSIHDFSQGESPPFVVTELLEGQTLRAHLASGPLVVAEALEYARQAARGLGAAHAKGIIHRDLKPENLFITTSGVLKILDFGLAKHSSGAKSQSVASEGLHRTLTQAGVVIGTTGYMAPEQVRGAGTDARTDVFSFGTVLYEMLMGHRPFQRESGAETLAAILRDEPPDLDELAITAPQLASIVRRCLEKDPERRFASAEDLLAELESVSATETPKRLRGIAWAAGLSGLALAFFVVLAGGHAWLRGGPTPETTASGRTHPIEFRPNPIDGAEYARVPAGSFTMGCTPANDNQVGCRSIRWQSPPRRITMARPYWIMRTEVTVGEFAAFAKAAGRPMPDAPVFDPGWHRADHPVNDVTWFDARDYCAWAGGRLPSESEWERAARASQDWAFVWGVSEKPQVEQRPRANTRDVSCEKKHGTLGAEGQPVGYRANGYDDGYPETSPAATFPPNDFGLFDMGGNVSEWCEDTADPRSVPGVPADDLTRKPLDGSAREEGDGGIRIIRDGNWDIGSIPVFTRWAHSPFGKASVTGFRCVRDQAP